MLRKIFRLSKAGILSFTSKNILYGNFLSFLEPGLSPQRSITRTQLFQHTSSLKNKMKKIIPVILLILIVAGVFIWVKSNLKTSNAASTDDRIVIKGPKTSQIINRNFEYPIKNDKGNEISKFKYSLESAELRDQILVKSQRIVAIDGMTFLILNTKITNNYTQAIDVNIKDYIRLTVNGNENEKIAADIHNDPVTVQALSTKISRLGFPINTSDKNLTLYLGEISGEKTKIYLNLH